MPKEQSNKRRRKNIPRIVEEKPQALATIGSTQFYTARYAFCVYILLKAHLSSSSDYLIKSDIHKKLVEFLSETMPSINSDVFTWFEKYTQYEETLKSHYKCCEEQPSKLEDLKKLSSFNRLDISRKEEKSWRNFTPLLANTKEQNQSLTSLELSIQSDALRASTLPIAKKAATVINLCTQLKETYSFLTQKNTSSITEALLACLDIILIGHSNEIGFSELMTQCAALYHSDTTKYKESTTLEVIAKRKGYNFTSFETLREVIKGVDQSTIKATSFYSSFTRFSEALKYSLGDARLKIWSDILANNKNMSSKEISKRFQNVEADYNLQRLYQRYQDIASTTNNYTKRIVESLTMLIVNAKPPQTTFSYIFSSEWEKWFKQRENSQDSSQINFLLEEWSKKRYDYKSLLINSSCGKLCAQLNSALKEKAAYQKLRDISNSYNTQSVFFTKKTGFIVDAQFINLCVQLEKAYQSMKEAILKSEYQNNIGAKLFKEIEEAFKTVQIALVDKIIDQLTQANNPEQRSSNTSMKDAVKALMRGYNPSVQYNHHPEWERGYQAAFKAIFEGISNEKPSDYFTAIIEKNFDSSHLMVTTPSPH